MFIHPRFSDPRKEYWDIYRKTQARMETWTEEEIRNFLSSFSRFRRIFMRFMYEPDTAAYYAAMDILRRRE